MEIRELRDDEAERAGEVVVAAYRTLDGAPPIDENGYADVLRAVHERARGELVMVAVDSAGAVVGCVTYVADEDSPYAQRLRPGEASMRMLGVAPDARRRGVGRALVEACVERAGAAGKVRVVLHSAAWMAAAHAMYESLGFVRVPERDWAPSPEIPLYCFMLDLGPPPDAVDR